MLRVFVKGAANLHMGFALLIDGPSHGGLYKAGPPD